MADTLDIKRYLAYWFQLGKSVALQKSDRLILPKVVSVGGEYSGEFERCWEEIVAEDLANCFLDGSPVSLAELSSGEWEIVGCARCQMPVPLPIGKLSPEFCPCHDLPTWPNTTLPFPRTPEVVNQRWQELQKHLIGRGVEPTHVPRIM